MPAGPKSVDKRIRTPSCTCAEDETVCPFGVLLCLIAFVASTLDVLPFKKSCCGSAERAIWGSCRPMVKSGFQDPRADEMPTERKMQQDQNWPHNRIGLDEGRKHSFQRPKSA